jgi:hypothetical protein
MDLDRRRWIHLTRHWLPSGLDRKHLALIMASCFAGIPSLRLSAHAWARL